MIFVGIDNGLDGCVAKYNPTDNTLVMIPTPFIKEDGSNKRKYDVAGMARIFQEHTTQPFHVFTVLESAQAMPGQGVSSMFSIGYGYGLWQGILVALQIPFTIVHPRTWQKNFLISSKQGDTKEQAFQKCSRQFPSHKFRTERGRLLDGQCDATLIAVYAQWYYSNHICKTVESEPVQP